MTKCYNIQPEIFLKGFIKSANKSGDALNPDNAFSNVMKNISGKSSLKADQINLNLKSPEGKNIIEQLKKILLSIDGNSSKIVLDDKALKSLYKLLVGSGFDTNNVEEVIHNISIERQLKVSDLMALLDDLNKVENNSDVMTDISVLPFLESIFKMFGMDNDTIEEILSNSKIEGIGIDLKCLMSELESKGYTDERIISMPENVQKIREMMTSIELMDGEENDGRITLEKFSAKLEEMVSKRQGRHSSDRILLQEAKKFVGLVKFDEDKNSDKMFFDKIRKIARFDPAAKIQSADNHKDIKTTEFLSNKSEISVNVSAGYNDLKNLSENIGKANNTKILQKDFTPTGKKITSTNLSQSKNEASWSGLNGESLEAKHLSSTSTGTQSASKSLPSYMLNQVSRQIVRSVENGNGEIRLQLKPPHLGRLQITLQSVNDSLKINIVTEHHATREMLIANSSELKSILFDQGIRLEKVEVQLAFNFEQSMSNTKHDFRKSNKDKNHHFNISGEVPGLDSISGEMNLYGSRRQGRLLDLVA